MTRTDERLAELAKMSARDLRGEWERVHGELSPAGFAADLLTRGIAYRLQVKGQGGLPPAILRLIRRGQVELAQGSVVRDQPLPLRVGTRLTRDWHGRTHHVTVVENGFDYADQPYRSLSAIARVITGAGWSGPRFFGLIGRARTADRG